MQSQAAAALGVRPATLSNWKHQSWWNPDWHNEDGYDVDAILKRPGAESQAERNELDAESRRMNQEERAMRLQLMQMRVDREAGRLVDLDSIIAAISECDQTLVAIIMDLPVRLARLIPEGELRKVILNEGDMACRNALRSYASHIRTNFSTIGKKHKLK